MMLPLRRVLSCLALLAGLGGSLAAPVVAAARAEATASPRAVARVLVVPIEGTVDDGMAHLVARAVDEANAAGEPLVLDVDTPGGLVSAAFDIRDSLFRAKVPTIAFVSARAFSAGALITLACRSIVMAPGSSIGAAEPIVTGGDQSHQAKFVSALSAEFRSTAERNHRSGLLASAMVDKHVDTPPWKAKDAILSLTATEAKRAGIADAVAATLPEALAALDDGRPEIARVTYSFGEQLVRFATSPEASGILLSIGVLGLLIEMQTLHGIAGLIGVLSLGLFFGTHVYAGFGNEFVIVLAVLGVLGILFELHVFPGHGLSGIAGLLLLGGAVLLSFGSENFSTGVQALAIAIVLVAAGLVVLVRLHPENAFMKRISFRGTQGPQYVSSSDFSDLLGRTGVATSFLRPAGVATVDGRRIDVLTDGNFVAAGSAVRVSRVEGARIFVEPVTDLIRTREEPA